MSENINPNAIPRILGTDEEMLEAAQNLLNLWNQGQEEQGGPPLNLTTPRPAQAETYGRLLQWLLDLLEVLSARDQQSSS
nr:hypothetical protein [Cressdnaviricota sp.]UOF78731.1 hypothetical protein [Cressdnaviricota sp.]